MLNQEPFYHGHIKNTVKAFGRLFSGIRFERKNTAGVTEQIIQVPVAYSRKEKWVQQVEQNPEGGTVYTTLPRIGFEIVGYSYDADRKLPRMNQVYCQDEDGRSKVFTPVPYNLDIALYFATKTQEDGLQILEQILPTFTPDYTLAVSVIPELNLVQDTPFILNSVSVEDDYDGGMEERRFVIHTLEFTAKINLFGGLSNIGLIKQVEVNIQDPDLSYMARQETPTSTIIESWTED